MGADQPETNHFAPNGFTMHRDVAMNIPALTGIRGIAALWVLIYHVQNFAGSFGMAWMWNVPGLRDGWIGVDLFFVLSGFILMLVHEADFKHVTFPSLFLFARLRFFRVYPLATVVLLLIALLALLDPGFAKWYRVTSNADNLTVQSFIRTLLLSTRWWIPFGGDWNQPVWSLSVEIIGYCAFPLLAFLTTRLRSRSLLLLLALVCLAAPTALANLQGRPFADDISQGAISRMAGGFTGGVILRKLQSTAGGMPQSRDWHVSELAILGVAVALYVPHCSWLAGISFGALVYSLAAFPGLGSWIFSSRPVLLLGKLSFPLYLVHVMPLLWLTHVLAGQKVPWPIGILILLLYFCFCLLLSLILHNWVERPSQRLGRVSFSRQRK